VDHVARLIEERGTDVWFDLSPRELLPEGTVCPQCGGDRFRKETDILDVWFDSGVSFTVLEQRKPYLSYPADLYLEGSDQHRGWFHSSLLCSVGTRGKAPFRSVLTHGFVVDGEGRKMSKSRGNVIQPEEVINRYGAEILRLWVASEDYRGDIRLSQEILDRLTEAYRRLRNTFRYLLGNLYDFNPSEDRAPYDDLLELDRWALHRLQELAEEVLQSYRRFEYHAMYQSIYNFCVLTLSSFYLDIVKDRLYVSAPKSKERRSAQTVLSETLECLVRIVAPVIPFTADEVWGYLPSDGRPSSVHADTFLPVREQWKDAALMERWEVLLNVRREVTKALEIARKQKIIGHSLDSSVRLALPLNLSKGLEGYREELRSICIVSSTEFVDKGAIAYPAREGGYESQEFPGLSIMVMASPHPKCERCWIHDPTVGQDREHSCLCKRCAGIVKELDLSN
jgi:isoleucyl-tRNA synthetase